MQRCRCGKRAYRDEIAAKFALSQTVRRRRERRPYDETRVYRCTFGGWHLTHEDKRSSA